MFVAATLIGFTVMQRYPNLKVVMAGGQASWMEEVLEKMEASTLTIPPVHYYPVRTDVEEMWEEGHVLLCFDAEERLIQSSSTLRSPSIRQRAYGTRSGHLMRHLLRKSTEG